MLCCCGVLYALTPPRGSPSPPLSLSTSQDLRPPPRESISQENCPPSPPSTKHVHTFSQSYPLTQCRHELLPVTPWFWFWGGIPRHFLRKFVGKFVWEISPRKVPRRAGGRPSRSFRDSDSDHRRPIEEYDESARIGSRTRHLAEDDLVLRFPEVLRHVDGGGGV